jgi:hypothetical protein
MLAIVFLLGAAFYQIDRYSVRLYYEELSQRLNSSLAMYVVNAEPLINGGQVNAAALSELAGRAMIINPTAEIYLLAPDGAILGHAFAPEEIDVDRRSAQARHAQNILRIPGGRSRESKRRCRLPVRGPRRLSIRGYCRASLQQRQAAHGNRGNFPVGVGSVYRWNSSVLFPDSQAS